MIGLIEFTISGYLFDHGGGGGGGGRELLFLTFHEFLIYVYEKYVILKILVYLTQYTFVVLHNNTWGGLRGVVPSTGGLGM